MFRVFFVSLVLLQCIHTPPTLFAQGKKGGGGTTPLPNIRFEVQFLGTLGGDRSTAYGMNEAGEIVGVSNDSLGVHRAARFMAGVGAVDLKINSRMFAAASLRRSFGSTMGAKQRILYAFPPNFMSAAKANP